MGLAMNKDLRLAILYFTASTVITWWFVMLSPLYKSTEQMLLSTSIAGGKWAIQLGLGLLFLKEKRYTFWKEIGYVCLMGSLLLFPYVLSASMNLNDATEFFIVSLLVAVTAMIYLYFKAVRATRVGLTWWFFWLLCLAVAISLQLTVVFDVV
jgi:hypothetical protein